MIKIVEALRAKRRASLIVEITCKCVQQVMDTEASGSSYTLDHLVIASSNTYPVVRFHPQ